MSQHTLCAALVIQYSNANSCTASTYATGCNNNIVIAMHIGSSLSIHSQGMSSASHILYSSQISISQIYYGHGCCQATGTCSRSSNAHAGYAFPQPALAQSINLRIVSIKHFLAGGRSASIAIN